MWALPPWWMTLGLGKNLVWMITCGHYDRAWIFAKGCIVTNEHMKKALEWFGVVTAIAYSLLVASNTGWEVLGFALLFISAIAIGLWAFLCKHYGMLILQFFYATAGIIGVLRWL